MSLYVRGLLRRRRRFGRGERRCRRDLFHRLLGDMCLLGGGQRCGRGSILLLGLRRRGESKCRGNGILLINHISIRHQKQVLELGCLVFVSKFDIEHEIVSYLVDV